MEMLSKLKWYLNASTAELENKFNVSGYGYGFKDNGANILAVVHLDTVLDFRKSTPHTPLFETLPSGDVLITSINLDDRLGLWLLCDYLPNMNKGIEYDILFTTDEEIGMSTAKFFETAKDYNWMFQFDRKSFGTVVMYEYETRELSDLLEDQYQYDVQVGTFSDICNLAQLGVAGFNFGCGYINEHTNYCSARLSWINTVVRMFTDFYVGECNNRYIYTPVVKSWKGGRHYHSGGAASGVPHSLDEAVDWEGEGYKWWEGVDEEAKDLGPKSQKDRLLTAGLDRYCEECGRKLLAIEEDFCEICLNVYGLGICKGCGTDFATEDLSSDGFCYDCR